MRRYLTPTRISFAGIDPGFKHLAVSVIECDVATMEIVRDSCVLVNAIVAQEKCKDPNCVHTNTTSCRLRHVYPELDKLIEKTCVVYIERQPLTGMTDIEQLLFDRWRQKSKLINSRKMRKRFDCWTDDYDNRKVLAVQTAKRLRVSSGNTDVPPWALGGVREHDAAEAWLYAYMAYTEWRAKEHESRAYKKRRLSAVLKSWEHFRYTTSRSERAASEPRESQNPTTNP